MKNDKRLIDIIERISGSIRVDQIILFGSRAHGGAQSDSDYDLLILCNEMEALPHLERRLIIRRLLSDFNTQFDIDLFVLTESELKQTIEKGSMFFKEASQGKLIYEASYPTMV